jgi:hypothetical protein
VREHGHRRTGEVSKERGRKFVFVSVSLETFFFSWATPPRSYDVKTFQVGGTIVKGSYQIDLYERNVQITQVTTLDLPILLSVIRQTLPEGVRLSVHEHLEEHYEARYIPDPFLEGIKKEMGDYHEKMADYYDESSRTREEKEEKKKQRLLASLEDDEDEDDY